MQYHNILRDYLREYAIPAMLEQGWAFKPAKSYGWEKAQRGPEYHVDQPLRTHILNGLYALTRVLEYLKEKRYYRIGENDFKRTLVLYTMHDAYKDFELASTRKGNSDFGIPLAELDRLLERMHLRQFVPVKAEDIRAASIALLSQKVADISSCSPDITHLLTLVHLADAFASQQTARDCKTAENRLRELIRSEAITRRQDERTSKRTGIPVQSNDINLPLCFYYHELDDYRGLSTLLIHYATEQVLDGLSLYPILYFANGILYLGPTQMEADAQKLRERIATTLFEQMRQEVGEQSYTVAEQALNYGQGLKFSKDVYLFSSLNDLVKAVSNYQLTQKPAGFVGKVIDKRVSRRKYASVEEFYTSYGIPVRADMDEALARRWNAMYFMLMGLESIAEALTHGDTVEWLLTTFHTPSDVAAAIRQNISVLRTGGVSDYCIVIAYHWLSKVCFMPGDRTALEVEVADVQQAAARHALQALAQYDTEERRRGFVNEALGLQSDIEHYLRTNLIFSFNLERSPGEGPLEAYEKPRNRSHKRTCVICNRDIPPGVSSEIITSIADQQAQVFSNKLLPSAEVKGQMVWCPMCYLEFMLRKLSGQGYPAKSDYNASYRLHLYVLPDYSFTPQLWNAIGEDLLESFYGEKTVVSKLALRGSKDEPSLPTRWLEQGKVDEGWLAQVREMFARQAAYLKTPTKEGKPRSKQGDRITFSFKNPNYMLVTYDNVVPDRLTSTEKAKLTPTHSEVWAKALYAATLIHLLTGARVYITDKPYLSITRPEEMKTIVETEGLHPLLYGLLPVRRVGTETTGIEQRTSESSTRFPLAALPVMLDLLAAIWEVTAALYQSKPGERRNLDKQVASILEEINANYLAGATLYKMRERDKAAPYTAFTRACRILLPQQSNQSDEIRHALQREGYELMLDKEGGDMMSLAESITNMSLKLYLPSTKKEGRAHRYETLFRTGVEAIKSNASIDDEELVARVAGNILKRLDRISGGACPTYGTAQMVAVKDFAELLIKQLFSQRCGRSVSKLTHEENHLADAIYYLTSQQINARWDDYKRRYPKKGGENAETDGETSDENGE
jgi:hypothetical protein